MILLDTNAVLWLQAGHRRTKPLARWSGRLYVSPISLLELQLLIERGGLSQNAVSEVKGDPRWAMDEPPLLACVEKAFELSWTRDVFDRLIVAHAQHRGWRLATGDGEIIERLGAAALEL